MRVWVVVKTVGRVVIGALGRKEGQMGLDRTAGDVVAGLDVKVRDTKIQNLRCNGGGEECLVEGRMNSVIRINSWF